MKKLLVDSGPFIAWTNRRDKHHERAKQFFANYKGSLLTTWPVMTEVCHTIPHHARVGFMNWIADGGAVVQAMLPELVVQLAIIMQKYNDQSIDLADASLLWLAYETNTMEIVTIDSNEFDTYRTISNRKLKNRFFD